MLESGNVGSLLSTLCSVSLGGHDIDKKINILVPVAVLLKCKYTGLWLLLIYTSGTPVLFLMVPAIDLLLSLC